MAEHMYPFTEKQWRRLDNLMPDEPVMHIIDSLLALGEREQASRRLGGTLVTVPGSETVRPAEFIYVNKNEIVARAHIVYASWTTARDMLLIRTMKGKFMLKRTEGYRVWEQLTGEKQGEPEPEDIG